MEKKVILSGKEFTLQSNAATPIRYRQVYGEDLLKVLNGNSDEATLSDVMKKLAYIMNKQAEGADFQKLNMETYCDWLAQFEVYDLELSAADIMTAYTGQTQINSELKKKAEELNEN